MHASWSVPPSQRPGRPLVVALHGRGHDESTLALLAPDLPPETVMACPRGPLREGPGWAWFEMHCLGFPVRASLARTRASVLAWLDEVAEGRPVALLGFSDGALLGLDLLLHAPSRFGAAVLLAGPLPFSTAPPLDDARLSGVRVHYSWGAQEDVLPQHLLVRTADWLVERSGADVTVEVEPGLVHAVSSAQVARAREVLEPWAAGRTAVRAEEGRMAACAR